MNEAKGQPIGAVVIGRNEGERLIRCLESILKTTDKVVYVDSGSDDDSVTDATALGVRVVVLDKDLPFTAARARNTGFEELMSHQDAPAYVQFVDGDCEVRAGWIDQAKDFLTANETVAAVCGRRRERYPDASKYNRLIDIEWDTPVGEAKSCGGDALMRSAALRAEGGYNPNLIAGEEPELCVRFRQAGWQIWRLDAEMTWHDAELLSFGQWWNRSRRAGFAFAEGASMHGAPPERHFVKETRRALVWGAGVPLVILAGCAISPWFLFLTILPALRVLKMRLRGFDLTRAAFLVLGNIPEAIGALEYYKGRVLGKKRKLIEYK